MGRALILLAVLSLLALVLAALVGLGVPLGLVGMASHIVISAAAVLLAMFTQIMVIMYLSGSGSRVRKAVRAGEDLREEYETARGFRKAVVPWASLSLVLVMATTILAGGVHTGVLPPVVHWGLVLLTLLVYGVAAYREILAIDGNERMMDRLDDVLARLDL